MFTAGGGIAKIAECYFSTSPGAITVTATYVSNNGGCLLAIKVLNGAHAVQTSAATVAAQYSGNNAVAAITTTVTGSVVYGCANDSSNNDAFTPNGATTTIKDYAEVAGGTELAAYKSTSATGTPGSTNLGGTFGVTGAGNLVMAEVLPAASVAVTKPPIVVSQYAALF